MVLMGYDPLHGPGTSVATAAALHAGLSPMDRPGRGPVKFHVPSLQGPEADQAYRHKELGFAFECHCHLLGRHTRYGYGTVAEASRYADLLRAARDGMCSSHRTLSGAEWDAVRIDPRTTVFDLCSEVADLEGRPYPGRPWSEERAKVRDVHPLSQRVGQVVGARIPG